MKTLLKCALGLFAFTIFWDPAPARAQRSHARCLDSLSPISSVYTKAVTVLRSKTSVPLRLPTCVWGLDSNDDLHAIVKSADESGYVLVLGATPDCQGQHVCSYGTMIGTSHPLDQIDAYDVTRRRRTLVKLHRGLAGYFYGSVCGAYCSDSFVTWTEGTYHYIIGLKAEKKSKLVASVNSAIDSGAQWKSLEGLKLPSHRELGSIAPVRKIRPRQNRLGQNLRRFFSLSRIVAFAVDRRHFAAHGAQVSG
jgi:hypothetical protein